MSLRTAKPGSSDNWEISVSSPTQLDVDPTLSGGNQKLSPRPVKDNGNSNTLNTDECWLINIKAPAALCVDTTPPDDSGNQVSVFMNFQELRADDPAWWRKMMKVSPIEF